MKYAILLRAVNLGPHNKVAMEDLRTALSAGGFDDVSTYLQSGNAVVSVRGRASPPNVAARAREAIAAELGLGLDLLVLAHRDLAAVVESNPFPAAAAAKPAWLHVFFTSAPPDPGVAIDPAKLGPDSYGFGERCVYLHFVNSPGKSRSGQIVCREALRPHPGAYATARNWNTVLAMAERTRP